MGRNPVPFLLALATASNIGSTATITGNPQNILIGSVSHIGYRDFLCISVRSRSSAYSSIGGYSRCCAASNSRNNSLPLMVTAQTGSSMACMLPMLVTAGIIAGFCSA